MDDVVGRLRVLTGQCAGAQSLTGKLHYLKVGRLRALMRVVQLLDDIHTVAQARDSSSNEEHVIDFS
jgi:hypothetical protein